MDSINLFRAYGRSIRLREYHVKRLESTRGSRRLKKFFNKFYTLPYGFSGEIRRTNKLARYSDQCELRVLYAKFRSHQFYVPCAQLFGSEV